MANDFYATPISEVPDGFIEAIPELPPPYASRDTEEVGNLPIVYALNTRAFKWKIFADENWKAAKSNPAYWVRIPVSEVAEVDVSYDKVEEALEEGLISVTLKAQNEDGETVRDEYDLVYPIPPLNPEYWGTVVKGIYEIIDPM